MCFLWHNHPCHASPLTLLPAPPPFPADAVEQTKVQGLVAFGMGMIDANQLGQAEQMQDNILDLVQSKQWHEARVMSDQLMAFITNASSSASLEDIRR